jgi:hypothetical protein
MKVFYNLLLLALFSFSTSAQSLCPGQVVDNVYNKTLLTQSFTLTNKAKSAAAQTATRETIATGETLINEGVNSLSQQEINFTISYNYDMNTLSGTTDYNGGKERFSSGLAIKSGSRFTDPSSPDLKSINFMQLQLSMGNHNLPVTISNLKLNGMDVTGSYTANTEGDIYWYIVYKDFGGDFTITGTINTESNFSGVDITDKVQFSFGSSAYLSAFPLSVYWGDINADQKNNGNVINWNTNKEENNDRFIIERATDGINFKGIGFKDGAGSRTLPSSYNFTDTSFTKGSNFYRIKQVDMVGRASYSIVVHITNNNSATTQTTEVSAALIKRNKTNSQNIASAKTVNDNLTIK